MLKSSKAHILLYTIISILVLSGCAQKSDAVLIGPDTYMITNQAASGFSGLSTLKTEAIQDGSNFCAKQGKYIRIISTQNSNPPYVLGNFPYVEIQFMCLSKSDRELTRPKLQPVTNTVIEVRNK
jgi:hypothetical protein